MQRGSDLHIVFVKKIAKATKVRMTNAMSDRKQTSESCRSTHSEESFTIYVNSSLERCMSHNWHLASQVNIL